MFLWPEINFCSITSSILPSNSTTSSSGFAQSETSSSPQYSLTIDTIEVAASWDNATSMYHNVLNKVKKIKGIVLFTAHVSHFYPNGVGMYFSFGGVEMGEQTNFEFYQKVWNTTMKAVLESGGSIAHHHGIGINRTNWMDEEWGKGCQQEYTQ